MQALLINEYCALVSARDGYFLVNRNDYYVGKALEIYGEFSAIEGKFIKDLLIPGDVVVEVGANIGAHTIGLARHVGMKGKVFAFEPQRSCYALLQAQIALNSTNNIFCFNEGVSSKTGKLWLPPLDYTKQGNFGGVSLIDKPDEGFEAVAVSTLDERLCETQIALLKIDVEGMEREVLEGAEQILSHSKPLLYVENDRVEKSSALIDFILARNYRLFWHTPPLFNPNNFFNISQNIYGNVASFNMLGVHESQNLAVTATMREIRSGKERHPLA